MSALPQQPGAWQAGFLSILPVVQTHARISFSRLPAQQRQDAIQEAIASACISYRLLAARGRLHEANPGTVADFAVKHVRNGRHVGGHQDAMSPVAQARHGFRVTGIDPFDPRTEQWRQVAVADRRADIPSTAAFRIDFARWLRSLTGRDRRIIAALAGGERTRAVADAFGITPGRVSQLRRKYERLWLAFQGERACQAA